MDTGVRLRRMNRSEYYRAWENEVFNHAERIELIRGQVYYKGEELFPDSPAGAFHTQSLAHSNAVQFAWHCLESVFEPGCHVRIRHPVVFDDYSETEPDLCVAIGDFRSYSDHPHAMDIRLIIEVSDTTLDYDRTLKGPLYAEFRIEEYWILNPVDRWLEVYREPSALPDSSYGYGYKVLIRN